MRHIQIDMPWLLVELADERDLRSSLIKIQTLEARIDGEAQNARIALA